MTGLVYIGKVVSVAAIPDADRIESLEVVLGQGGRWRGTAQKGQFKTGDCCQVYLQDCLVPHTPELAFMENNQWRIRMRRFRGVPSEVLIKPQTIPGEVGADVTIESGATKFEKPLPANLAGEALGFFPGFIPKTDEPNFQTVPEMVQALRGHSYYATVKADGSSATIFRTAERFGCCSRNLEFKDTPNNAIWQLARRFELEKNIPLGISIQCEVVGPGIQKNPMGLLRVEPRLFNVWDIEARRYWNCGELRKFCSDIGFPMVEVIADGQTFDFDTDDALRALADGNYDNGKPREGIVIRPTEEMRMPTGDRVSFKIINLSYKD
jgi:RNA ligase (TIGR02306 family)